MKLKQATQLAIIGVILQLLPAIIWSASNILGYEDWFRYLNLISLIGIALLLPFFVTLFKSQK
ncbi:hypothetical protein AGMMS4956_10250 [Bacteroidia bacterium]|nr:hypothetical protein AGMMS4956_10250 [Bacteroidia bacterium]